MDREFAIPEELPAAEREAFAADIQATRQLAERHGGNLRGVAIPYPRAWAAGLKSINFLPGRIHEAIDRWDSTPVDGDGLPWDVIADQKQRCMAFWLVECGLAVALNPGLRMIGARYCG